MHTVLGSNPQRVLNCLFLRSSRSRLLAVSCSNRKLAINEFHIASHGQSFLPFPRIFDEKLGYYRQKYARILSHLTTMVGIAAITSNRCWCSKDPYFHNKYETLKKRRGHKKAIIAIAIHTSRILVPTIPMFSLLFLAIYF